MRSISNFDGQIADVVHQVVEIVKAENPDHFTLSPKGHIEIHNRIKEAMKIAQEVGAEEVINRYNSVGRKIKEEIEER